MGIGLWQRWTRNRARATCAPAPDRVESVTPPPLDAEEALAVARKEFARDPRGAIERLEALRRSHRPDPVLLHGLSLLHQQAGDTRAAIRTAREAIPLCLRRGMGLHAAELLDRIDADAAQLGMGRGELVAIGGALSRTHHWRLGFRALASIALAEPDADDVALELLRLADRLDTEHELPEEAVKVLVFLTALCPDPARGAEIAARLAALEERLWVADTGTGETGSDTGTTGRRRLDPLVLR